MNITTATLKVKPEDTPVACLKCGYPVSPYYFSPIKLKDGQTVISHRCLNCGFFDCPE